MTILKQDALDMAALETSIAARIRAKITTRLPEQSHVLYYAYKAALLRAAALIDLAPTFPTEVADVMPPPNPTGSYAPTGNVIQINFENNAPGYPIAGWNSIFADQQQVRSAAFLTTAGQATTVYKPARPNTLDSNFYGEPANPPDTGIIPDNAMRSNHTGGGSYEQLDVLRGLNPNFAYDIRFYGSRMADDELTLFTMGAESIVLDTSHNTTRAATFRKIRSSPSGTINWSWVATGPNTEASAMAAMVLTEFAPA
jgi:hypothetical protein